MNWLAHLYLSEPSPAFRIGNLLPDLLPLPALQSLEPEMQRGVEQHRRIDAFTDSHALVRASICRIEPPFRRFGGILTDVFFDHFLARQWAAFSNQPLTDFVEEVYGSFTTHQAQIPFEAHAALQHMEANDWLRSYQHLDGLSRALHRIGRRFRRPVPLDEAMPLFERHYEAFQADFAAFFPELVVHVAGPG